MNWRSPRLLGVVGLIALLGCRPRGPVVPSVANGREIMCGEEVRVAMDCGAYYVAHDGENREVKVGAAGKAGPYEGDLAVTKSSSIVAIREASQLVQVMKSAQLANCQGYNACAIDKATFTEREREIAADYRDLTLALEHKKQETVAEIGGKYGVSAGSGAPAGTVVAYAGEVEAGFEPAGWLLCDGRTVEQSTFAALAAALGPTYETSDGKLRLPDYRGYFLRGFDKSGKVDEDREGTGLGVVQEDAFETHVHEISIGGPGGSPGAEHRGDRNSDNIYAAPTGGKETRPKNVAVNYLIKF